MPGQLMSYNATEPTYLVKSGTSSATSLGTIVSVTLWIRMTCSEEASERPAAEASSPEALDSCKRSRLRIPAEASTALSARRPKS